MHACTQKAFDAGLDPVTKVREGFVANATDALRDVMICPQYALDELSRAGVSGFQTISTNEMTAAFSGNVVPWIRYASWMMTTPIILIQICSLPPYKSFTGMKQEKIAITLEGTNE